MATRNPIGTVRLGAETMVVLTPVGVVLAYFVGLWFPEMPDEVKMAIVGLFVGLGSMGASALRNRSFNSPKAVSTSLVLLVAFLLPGCATYSHLETYHENGALATWRTRVIRPWGTTDMEWANTAERGKGSIRGDGMSDNLQQTLGDDVVATVAEEVRRGLVPVSALGDIFGGDDEEGSEAETN